MRVPLLDLKAQYSSIREEVQREVLAVLESQMFILGPVVEQCERAVAAYCGASYGVGVSSGTDALVISLMAEGIGPGDEVITTAYSFFATAGSIARVGATPVFVDIDPDTFNMNPALVERAITSKTKAVIPVHLFGQMADMGTIGEIARRHGLVVIEDAAQAIGAQRDGRRAGTVGQYGCFSFFPSKNLGGAGDGGMVVTDDASRAEKLVLLRAHGAKPKYFHKLIGGNFRLDAIQAAVIGVKLKYLDGWIAQRQRNAARYEQLFNSSGLVRSGVVVLPVVKPGRHVFNQYVIRVKRRDELKAWLAEHGVATEVYYPIPLHLQECFCPLGYSKGDMPEAERAAKETLALPIYPELSDAQAEYVVQSIRSFFR